MSPDHDQLSPDSTGEFDAAGNFVDRSEPAVPEDGVSEVAPTPGRSLGERFRNSKLAHSKTARVALSGAAALGFSGVAAEQASANFTVDDNVVYEGDTVTATDTSGYLDGTGERYYWRCRTDQPFVEGGKTFQCIYPDAGEPMMAQKVMIGSDQVDFDQESITVYPASGRPGGITRTSPDTLALPDVVSYRSKKNAASLDCVTGGNLICETVPLPRTGPDAEGFYTYSYRIPLAAENVRLDFDSYNFTQGNGSDEELQETLPVASNAADPFMERAEALGTTPLPDTLNYARKGKTYTVESTPLDYYAPDPTTETVKATVKYKTPQGKRRTKRPQVTDQTPVSYQSKQLDAEIPIKSKWLKNGRKVKVKLVQTVTGQDGTVHYRDTDKVTLTKKFLKRHT